MGYLMMMGDETSYAMGDMWRALDEARRSRIGFGGAVHEVDREAIGCGKISASWASLVLLASRIWD